MSRQRRAQLFPGQVSSGELAALAEPLVRSQGLRKQRRRAALKTTRRKLRMKPGKLRKRQSKRPKTRRGHGPRRRRKQRQRRRPGRNPRRKRGCRQKEKRRGKLRKS